MRIQGNCKIETNFTMPLNFCLARLLPANAQVKRKTWRFLCRSKYLCQGLSLGYCVCSLNVLSTFIPIKSESILSVCFVFINKKRTKRDGAKYMFIVHTTCNVFKRWQYILKIKRYLTNAPQQTILTRTPPNHPTPTPILSSNCQNNRSRLEQTAETDNFLYAVVCAIIFPGKM